MSSEGGVAAKVQDWEDMAKETDARITIWVNGVKCTVPRVQITPYYLRQLVGIDTMENLVNIQFETDPKPGFARWWFLSDGLFQLEDGMRFAVVDPFNFF